MPSIATPSTEPVETIPGSDRISGNPVIWGRICDFASQRTLVTIACLNQDCFKTAIPRLWGVEHEADDLDEKLLDVTNEERCRLYNRSVRAIEVGTMWDACLVPYATRFPALRSLRHVDDSTDWSRRWTWQRAFDGAPIRDVVCTANFDEADEHIVADVPLDELETVVDVSRSAVPRGSSVRVVIAKFAMRDADQLHELARLVDKLDFSVHRLILSYYLGDTNVADLVHVALEHNLMREIEFSPIPRYYQKNLIQGGRNLLEDYVRTIPAIRTAGVSVRSVFAYGRNVVDLLNQLEHIAHRDLPGCRRLTIAFDLPNIAQIAALKAANLARWTDAMRMGFDSVEDVHVIIYDRYDSKLESPEDRRTRLDLSREELMHYLWRRLARLIGLIVPYRLDFCGDDMTSSMAQAVHGCQRAGVESYEHGDVTTSNSLHLNQRLQIQRSIMISEVWDSCETGWRKIDRKSA